MMDTARYLAATQGGEPEDYLPTRDLDGVAGKLGGEVDGTWIRCPSPGQPPDDRSCHIRFDPTRHDRFFVYGCEGPMGAAYTMVRMAVGIRPPRTSNGDAIARLWDEAQPARGTPVEKYLRSRAILVPVPIALRYHPELKHVSGRRWPGMVAERLDSEGRRVAVHRTFLRPDGGGKAPVEPQRMDLGPTTGTAIRLAAATEDLVVAEGIETTLSVMQASGTPGWAAGSAVALRCLILPPEVRRITICADGDAVGEAAARGAAARWQAEGRRVRIARAPAGKDFNDLLMEARS